MVSTLYFESNDPSTLLVDIFIFYTLESILYLSKGSVGNLHCSCLYRQKISLFAIRDGVLVFYENSQCPHYTPRKYSKGISTK